MKTILFVGTMYKQKLQTFIEAKNLGLKVALIGQSFPKWAEKYIDYFIKADTLDKEQAINKLQSSKLNFDGVITFWDRDVELVSKIAEYFNLPGSSIDSAKLSRNKFLSREKLQNSNVKSIRYCLLKQPTIDDLFHAVKEVGLPCIIKPVSASASKGVFKINHKNEIKKTYTQLATIVPKKDIMFSYNSSQFIVEEFVDGPEYSVEAVIQNGIVHIVGITEKISIRNFEEIQHVFPANLNEEIEELVKRTTISALEVLKLDNCGTHTELKITSKGPVIIEVNGRLGGDFITTHLVPIASGINIVQKNIQIALGQPIYVTRTKNKGACIRFIISEREGILKRWEINSQLFINKNLVTFHKEKRIGQKVLLPPQKYHDARIGYLITKGKNNSEARKVANQMINDYIEVKLDEQ